MDYRTEQGCNLIYDWCIAQDIEVQAEFEAILTFLAATADWNGRKDCKPLTRQHTGLWEIIFKKGNIRYRPVGFFGPNGDEFILILGCKKIGGNYIPTNAFDLALEFKRKFLEEGRGSICDHV